MAASILPPRRPQLSLQINRSEQSSPVISKSIFGPSSVGGTMEPMSAVGGSLPFGRCTAAPSSPRTRRAPTPLTIVARPSRFSRPTQLASPSDSETEEDSKFWSGEDSFSSATSSEDESASDSEKKITTVKGVSRVVLPTPAPQSPFLPPARNTLLQPHSKGTKKFQLRLNTAVTSPNESTQISTPTTTESPASFLPLPRPATRAKLTLSIPAVQQTCTRRPALLTSATCSSTPSSCMSSRKSSLASRKSVSFSPLPDTVISTSQYTLSNSDLLFYLSTDCSEEELVERWGMTLEDVKLLGLSKKEKLESSGASKLDRRERKWIGLTNSFLRKDDQEI